MVHTMWCFATLEVWNKEMDALANQLLASRAVETLNGIAVCNAAWAIARSGARNDELMQVLVPIPRSVHVTHDRPPQLMACEFAQS